MSMNRRVFLRKTAYYGLGAATLGQTIQTFSVVNALAQTPGDQISNYRALVCIFFGGGNDSNNLLIPNHTDASSPYGSYTNYANERSGATGSNIAIAQASLASINAGPNLLNHTWGFHPNAATAAAASPPPIPHLQGLYNNNKLAAVCNVGPLVVPLVSPSPRAAYQNSANQKPFQLFSHSDQVQQWQTCISNMMSSTGWGGRLADNTNAGSTVLPIVTSVTGNSPVFSVGQTTRPLIIGTGALNTIFVLSGFGTTANETARRTAMNQLRGLDTGNNLVAASSDIMNQAVQVGQNLQTDPVIATVFPNTTLGNQLRQVAKVIKANLSFTSPLPLNRQIFFVTVGGFDTHSNQLVGQGNLITQLSQAMASFYQATQELNAIHPTLSQRIVAFTHSDFSRTWNPNANTGTDHGWGSNQLVMGDAVDGGKFFGVVVPANGTTYPTLLKSGQGGNYDAATRGLWVPNVATAQYARVLARWYGLAPADENTVFPNLSTNFGSATPATLNFLP